MKAAVAAVVFCLPYHMAHAAGTGLFPSVNQDMAPMTRVDSDAIPPLEVAPAKPVEIAPSRGPLRVVIPNIKQAKPVVVKQSRPRHDVAAVTPAPAELPPIQSNDAVTDANVAMLQTNEQGIGGYNGVMIDTANVRSSVAYAKVAMFLAVPANWVIQPQNNTTVAAANADAAAMADLMPAAGTLADMSVTAAAMPKMLPPPPIVPTGSATATPPASQPTAPATQAGTNPSGANGVIVSPTPAVAPIAAAPAPPTPVATSTAPPAAAKIVPEKPAFESSPNDPSEPKPTLSAQSKAILDKLPNVEDKKIASEGKDVKIDRESAKPEFGGDVQVSSHESKGIKVDVRQPSVDVSYQLEKAYNALIAGKSDVAIKIYEDVLTNDPNNNDALFGLASTYHRVGQLDLARSLYGKLLARNPNHRDGLNNFLVLLAEEAPEEALQQMEKLEAKNPGFSPIPAQMAVIYKKLGKMSQAVDKMYHALALSPENVTYRYNLAVMLDKAGEREKAATLYQQVLSAQEKGEVIPGDAQKIQQRLTFIRSNTRR